MRGPLRRVNEATDAGWRCTSIAASTTMAANWSARTPGSCIRLPWRVSWRPWRLGGSPLPSALSWRLLRQAAYLFRRCRSGPRGHRNEPRAPRSAHQLGGLGRSENSPQDLGGVDLDRGTRVAKLRECGEVRVPGKLVNLGGLAWTQCAMRYLAFFGPWS